MTKNDQKNKNKQHFPVLLEETLSILNPQKGESYLDLTAGYGGHASEVLERTFQPEKALLVDRDQNAIAHLTELFGGNGVAIIHMDFSHATTQLHAEKQQFDIILADLGVSSPHLNEASRGFAIKLEGPLDMRMDNRQDLTAEYIVNNWSKAELEDIFSRYGEEPKAKKIAELIQKNRPITTTTQLATIVAQAWPGYSRLHPATRTFQALRIAVNDELSQLKESLPKWVDLLAPDGRLAVISFHSLEDRIVKQYFAEQASDGYQATVRVLTKRPIMARQSEIDFNPRARSAKLRAVAKINTKTKRKES